MDENNRPVPAGVFSDKLLVTVLFNRSQPLNRYEISGRLKISLVPTSSSSCGLAYRTIEAVEGRREDILVMPGKGQSRLQVHPNVFSNLMDQIPNQGWQINQQKDGSLQVLVVEGSPVVNEEMVNTPLVKILADQGVATPEVKVEKVRAIPKGESGKSPLIKAYRNKDNLDATNSGN